MFYSFDSGSFPLVLGTFYRFPIFSLFEDAYDYKQIIVGLMKKTHKTTMQKHNAKTATK